ncbi:MAG: ATP cone domain-containing protein [Actinophytocola sp.]|uniref:ATP cone domain-containing protein n=1 Tax=Actinophytocola sp. TaxID=1872138 RepID=UPI003D6BAF1E
MSEFACPTCGADTRVSRTFKTSNMIRRTRTCVNATERHSFETWETAASADYLVERRSGRIEPFDQRNALEQSIRLATAGKIQGERATALARAVMARLDMKPMTPVSTEEIGLAVIDELADRTPPGALRFATIFLSARGIVASPEELLEWLEGRYPSSSEPAPLSGRPSGVVKRPRGDHAGVWIEDFEIRKLWRGILICTHGLVPETEASSRTDWTPDIFVGAIVAAVLERLHGQQLVTSGQMSGVVLEVLRAVSRFGFMRYSIVAKRYERKKYFVEELRALIEYPSPKFDLDEYFDRGVAIADEVAKLRAPR